MSITIDLPTDVQQMLAQRASALGLPIEKLALDFIAQGVARGNSLDAILAPIRERFQASRLTDDEVAHLVEEVRGEITHEKHIRFPIVSLLS